MALALVLSAGFVHAPWIPLHLLTFFAGSVVCHGALARRRPAPRHLSTFYVTIAIGGLLGGVFNAIIAPSLFDRIIEYPMAIVLGGFLAPGGLERAKPTGRRGWLIELLPPAVIFVLTSLLVTNSVGLAESAIGVLGVMIASGLGFHALVKARRRPLRFALATVAVLAASGLTQGVNGRLLLIERNFFGVVRVTEDADLKVHRLFHGSTLHGQQSPGPVVDARALDLLHALRADRSALRGDGDATRSAGEPRRGGRARRGDAGRIRAARPALDILRDRPRHRSDRPRSEVLHLPPGLPG